MRTALLDVTESDLIEMMTGRATLDLPAGARIGRVVWDAIRSTLVAVIESPVLPEVPPGAFPPHVPRPSVRRVVDPIVDQVDVWRVDLLELTEQGR